MPSAAARLLLALTGGLVLQATARVQTVVDVGPAGSDGIVPVTVRTVTTGVVLGSYQGTVRFAPGSVRLVQAATPRGGDATRLLNAADTASGLIRFAGYTVRGFRHDTVLTLRVRPIRPIGAMTFVAALDVAADSAGTRVPRDRLIPSSAPRPRP